METPRSLRSTIFCHLAELLTVEDSNWEMVAMVFFVEVRLRALLHGPHNMPNAVSGAGAVGGLQLVPWRSG